MPLLWLKHISVYKNESNLSLRWYLKQMWLIIPTVSKIKRKLNWTLSVQTNKNNKEISQWMNE